VTVTTPEIVSPAAGELIPFDWALTGFTATMLNMSSKKEKSHFDQQCLLAVGNFIRFGLRSGKLIMTCTFSKTNT